MAQTVGFYKGYKVMVVAVTEVQKNLIVKVIEDFNPRPEPSHIGQEWMIKPSELQRLCMDAFKIGDKVAYKCGTMQGQVVGYELPTNRCVVMSDKIAKYHNDRTRYVYSVSELEDNDPNLFKFKLGQWYIVDGRQLFAVDSVFNPGEQLFLFFHDGTIAFKDIPRVIYKSALLNDYGIHSIKKA